MNVHLNYNYFEYFQKVTALNYLYYLLKSKCENNKQRIQIQSRSMDLNIDLRIICTWENLCAWMTWQKEKEWDNDRGDFKVKDF